MNLRYDGSAGSHPGSASSGLVHSKHDSELGGFFLAEQCCRIAELRCKEVISVCDGNRIGFVSDVQIDTCTGRLFALVVPGRARFFGLFGRKDYLIPWESIRRIGEDLILTTFEVPPEEQKPCHLRDLKK